MAMKKIQYMNVFIVIIGLLCLCNTSGGDSSDDTLTDKCSDAFGKVSNCLSYVTEKDATPSKGCCESVTDIRDSNPVCLCFIILQTHNGSKQIKAMGIQESRLLMLPSACNLVNANVSDCPLLLNIPKGSPEYAIFNTTTSTLTPSTPASSSTTTSKDGSKGFKHGPDNYLLVGPMLVAMLFVLLPAFPAGSFSPPCT